MPWILLVFKREELPKLEGRGDFCEAPVFTRKLVLHEEGDYSVSVCSEFPRARTWTRQVCRWGAAAAARAVQRPLPVSAGRACCGCCLLLLGHVRHDV